MASYCLLFFSSSKEGWFCAVFVFVSYCDQVSCSVGPPSVAGFGVDVHPILLLPLYRSSILVQCAEGVRVAGDLSLTDRGDIVFTVTPLIWYLSRAQWLIGCWVCLFFSLC